MPKKEQENPIEELQERFERWDYLYTHGCRDPLNADGVNLNLVRTHIEIAKKKIEELYEPQHRPEIYNRLTPEKVPYEYMARADEIQENARRALKLFESDENYQYLASKLANMRAEHIKQTSIEFAVGCAKRLRKAIETNDLVMMRLHEDGDRYLNDFAECAKKVRELKPQANEQTSLFDSYEDEANEIQISM